MKVDNAIILAAGTASRFAPLSYEIPKGLIEVKGEVLIERQIKQLKEAGIPEIIIVTGYKSQSFAYLKDKYNVILVHNPDYLTRNNHSSIYAVRDYLKNSYICSSDNYFIKNPFTAEVEESYYSAIYAQGKTSEWCITEENNWIKAVHICGANSWIMLGHVFWSEAFSKKFLSILQQEYTKRETKDKLWENIYIEHIHELPMQIRKYPADFIFEFDTLDELRKFDTSYVNNTRSDILKHIAHDLGTTEGQIHNIKAIKNENNAAIGFAFECSKKYKYVYETQKLEEVNW